MANVRVKLPNGDTRSAEVTSKTQDGYRTARIRNYNGFDSIYGWVSARHGFKDGRVLDFEVCAEHQDRLNWEVTTV